MLRLKESLKLLLQKLALLKQSLDAPGARFPALQNTRVFLAKRTIPLLELVILVCDVRICTL